MTVERTGSRRFVAAWIAALALAWPCSGQGQAPAAPPTTANAMSLQQVLDQAKTHNPALLAAEQNLLAVKAQEIQAGVRANPNFALNGANVTLNVSRDLTTSTTPDNLIGMLLNNNSGGTITNGGNLVLTVGRNVAWNSPGSLLLRLDNRNASTISTGGTPGRCTAP